MIDLPKRPRVRMTLASRQRIWQTRDGRYRLVHSRSLVSGVSEIWYVMERRTTPAPWRYCWDILSRHRTRRAAWRRLVRVSGDR